ncbi:MAG TPA: phosphate/phosphite/phosphonate ABC transporter substrate-binding protein [Chloroflexi bacterium]|nr:phosphate/phosphite/phosphonate ABC transporter substrate-binding protein [Chloroflexota bacterium]
MLAACAPPAAGDHIIYLSDLEPLPPPPSEDVVPLRVAVAAVISPTGTLESYQPLLDYISDETGRPVELIQRRTYAEINDLIKRGEVDVAFVCTSAYVEGHRDFGMELLAAPQVNGAPVYYSLLIVPADSPAQNMVDLRGSVFAFTDPMSTTGRVYPTYLVEQLGSTPAAFFSRTFFTYSHDDAIRAVASGVADGAAVDSLVYEAAIQRDPSLTERVRIIQRSPPFAAPPVVVNPALRPRLRAEIQALLFDLPYSPEGREILDALGVERFVPISDSAYDPVRELIDAVTPLAQAGE